MGIPEVKRLEPSGLGSFAGVSIHDLRRSLASLRRRSKERGRVGGLA
jgi:hypothetical protein